MKLIFMGTPDFAVPALSALIEAGHDVLAVYTQPPRPAGRGQQPRQSSIHNFALSHDIEVLTPKTLRNSETQQLFRDLDADAAIIVAYGLILPKEILEACQYGCINIHPSLLPRWRGAAPIPRSIMAGDDETGVMTVQMDAGLDTGDILMEKRIAMPSGITTGELHDILAEEGANLLIETLRNIASKGLSARPQGEEGLTYAEKIEKSEGKIDWGLSAKTIDCLIRGLTPWPGAFFIYKDEKFKVLSAKFSFESHGQPVGTVLDNILSIACKDGSIQPLMIQRQGKKPIDVKAFLNGFSIPIGTIL